jgi:pyrroloquinoline-quinone synthase
MKTPTLQPPLSIEPRILSHPWYRKWEMGELPADSLRHYAGEYYWQVAHFPRYLSRLHSQLDSLEQRQVILRNLADEENPSSPHPELWLQFAQALGLDPAAIRSGAPGPAARELIQEFTALVDAGPHEGLGAILAYESQVPEVARFKADALEKYYLKGAEAALGTRFFKVHQEADVWHTRELQGLLEGQDESQALKTRQASSRAATALWKFLDAMPN